MELKSQIEARESSLCLAYCHGMVLLYIEIPEYRIETMKKRAEKKIIVTLIQQYSISKPNRPYAPPDSLVRH